MARPRLLATLEGYAVEGGFDGRGEPATCFAPTIALGRHPGPGAAMGLWTGYERLLEHAASLGLDGVRLTLEWARVEPRRGEVDVAALDRYARAVAHARTLGLEVTVALVDAAWPAWLGQEAWLMPWVGEHVVAHARRVAEAVDPARLVAFADARRLVEDGFLLGTAPPWRRGARPDAAYALGQLRSITDTLQRDDRVGPRLATSFRSIPLDLDPATAVAARRAADGVEELHLRSLLKGSGPTSAPAGLLQRAGDGWAHGEAAQLLAVLR
jgi:beta-glucosidase/6-phospho-beta-glucosidase/beta-galactosidase